MARHSIVHIVDDTNHKYIYIYIYALAPFGIWYLAIILGLYTKTHQLQFGIWQVIPFDDCILDKFILLLLTWINFSGCFFFSITPEMMIT